MSAALILQELGGSQFQSTVNARDFNYPRNGVSFRLARPVGGITRVTITKADTGFTMLFYRGQEQVASANGIGQSQLRAVFAKHTGI
jgi:hypothetical protein